MIKTASPWERSMRSSSGRSGKGEKWRKDSVQKRWRAIRCCIMPLKQQQWQQTNLQNLTRTVHLYQSAIRRLRQVVVYGSPWLSLYLNIAKSFVTNLLFDNERSSDSEFAHSEVSNEPNVRRPWCSASIRIPMMMDVPVHASLLATPTPGHISLLT